MTTGRPHANVEPPDDAAIEQLVRDVVSGWAMPPVRLDAPSWRGRVRGPGVRRMAATRGWLGRVGQAATAAVALTVAGALVAVVLTGPNRDAGKSPEPSRSAAPGSPAPSRAGEASLLPKLLVPGDLPSPSRFLVQVESDWSIVDLELGALGEPITGAQYGSSVHVEPDGSLVCLCLRASDRVNGAATHAAISLDRFDGDGARTSTTPIESFVGQPDPRDTPTGSFDYPPHVLTAMSFDDRGRFGFVGWAAREHPVWKSGIVVVDLADGSVVSRLELPDSSTGAGERRTVVQAPRVVGSASAGEVLIARGVEDWSSPDMETASVRFDSDVFRVELTAGRWSSLATVPNTLDCGESVIRGGGLEDGGVWLACSSTGGNAIVLRRVAGDGRLLNDISATRRGAISGDTTAMTADGRSLFAWDPIDAQLAKIDVATGEKAVSPAVAGASTGAGPGPVTALGEWLAPSVAAKSFVQSAIVVSPDGSRVYALGVSTSASDRAMSGSTGVYVFDAATLEPIGHWEPTADFVSLTASRDGRFIYAAGVPGFDAAGRVLVNQAASITVFEAATGARSVVAGQLGREMVLFAGPVLD